MTDAKGDAKPVEPATDAEREKWITQLAPYSANDPMAFRMRALSARIDAECERAERLILKAARDAKGWRNRIAELERERDGVRLVLRDAGVVDCGTLAGGVTILRHRLERERDEARADVEQAGRLVEDLTRDRDQARAVSQPAAKRDALREAAEIPHTMAAVMPHGEARERMMQCANKLREIADRMADAAGGSKHFCNDCGETTDRCACEADAAGGPERLRRMADAAGGVG